MCFRCANKLMSDPRCYESRMVFVFDEKEKVRGYVSMDGDKIVEAEGKELTDTFYKVLDKCRNIVGDEFHER